MGAVKKFIKTFTPIGIVGGMLSKDKPKEQAAPAEPAEPVQSASEIAEAEEKKKRAAIVAANAGDNQNAGTLAGSPGETNVSRRNLLGL